MAKGRRFEPSKEKEGNWFCTSGWPRTLDDSKPPEKRVASAPERFEEKHEVPFKRFPFSSHDNRHAFQDEGEYFGNGLGRRTFPDRCQHYSSNLITWNATNDARTCYVASFQGVPGADNSRYRRFPRFHTKKNHESAPLRTTTTKWFQRPDVPFKTPLNVLAITQEPFLAPNQWAYSYRPTWR
ncbi:testis-expressed protein 36-like [Montipora capricornis]|uniref:testis-expressed protein 36-like n=1 Tax=Montipora foliosa TaxID=591990 RepID=UPI0035F1F598